MKVKELIEELQKQDPEKDVMIQQGEEFDYMAVYTVKEKDVEIVDLYDQDDESMVIVAIEYS